VAQTWAISLILARHVLPWAGVTSHAETIAHAVGIMVPVVSSYYGHKHFSFKS
jgi:putative flippase GtrA